MFLFISIEDMYLFEISDAPIDLKIKTHMICDLLNLSSIPCTDPAIYSNKQRQQKIDSNCQSEQLKRVSFISFSSSSSKNKKETFWTFSIDQKKKKEILKS
jgi:hypothetical protein